MSDIDPRDFGRLEAEVATLSNEVAALNRKVDSLLDLANRGRGAFWLALILGGVVGSVLSGVVGKVISRIIN